MCLQSITLSYSEKTKNAQLLELCQHLQSTAYCQSNPFALSIVDMYLGDYYKHQEQWDLAEKSYLKSVSVPFENEDDIDDTSPLWPYTSHTVKVIQQRKYAKCAIYLLLFPEKIEGMQYLEKSYNLFPSLQTFGMYNSTISTKLCHSQYEQALMQYRNAKFFNYDRNQYLPKQTQQKHGNALSIPLMQRDEFIIGKSDVYDNEKFNTLFEILDVSSIDPHLLPSMFFHVDNDSKNEYMDPLNGILCLKLKEIKKQIGDKKYFSDHVSFNLLKLSIYNYNVENASKYYENDAFCYECVLNRCNNNNKPCTESYCDDLKLSNLIKHTKIVICI